MAKVTDLRHLCQMPVDELTEIIENLKNAKLIYEFFNKTVTGINIFDKELDFEDVNMFVENEKIDTGGEGRTKSKPKKVRGVIKQDSSSNLKKKTSSKRLK